MQHKVAVRKEQKGVKKFFTKLNPKNWGKASVQQGFTPQTSSVEEDLNRLAKADREGVVNEITPASASQQNRIDSSLFPSGEVKLSKSSKHSDLTSQRSPKVESFTKVTGDKRDPFQKAAEALPPFVEGMIAGKDEMIDGPEMQFEVILPEIDDENDISGVVFPEGGFKGEGDGEDVESDVSEQSSGDGIKNQTGDLADLGITVPPPVQPSLVSEGTTSMNYEEIQFVGPPYLAPVEKSEDDYIDVQMINTRPIAPMDQDLIPYVSTGRYLQDSTIPEVLYDYSERSSWWYKLGAKFLSLRDQLYFGVSKLPSILPITLFLLAMGFIMYKVCKNAGVNLGGSSNMVALSSTANRPIVPIQTNTPSEPLAVEAPVDDRGGLKPGKVYSLEEVLRLSRDPNKRDEPKSKHSPYDGGSEEGDLDIKLDGPADESAEEKVAELQSTG